MTVTDYIRSRPWLIKLGLIVVGLLVVLHWLERPGAPVRDITVSVDKQIVTEGAPVAITFSFVRDRLCRTSVSSYWEDSTGKRVLSFPPSSRRSATLGQISTTQIVPAPPVSGRMCFNTDAHHVCDDGSYEMTMPDACVLVVPKQGG